MRKFASTVASPVNCFKPCPTGEATGSQNQIKENNITLTLPMCRVITIQSSTFEVRLEMGLWPPKVTLDTYMQGECFAPLILNLKRQLRTRTILEITVDALRSFRRVFGDFENLDFFDPYIGIFPTKNSEVNRELQRNHAV